MAMLGETVMARAIRGDALVGGFRVRVFPLVFGKGKRLFGDGTPSTMLKMVDHEVTAKGTVVATYEPGGTLPAFPPFGPQPSTSSREAERQRRMAEGSW